MRLFRLPFLCLLCSWLLPVTTPAAAERITVYRCLDAKGRVALRDRPCGKDAQQTTRQLTAPVDPPRPTRLTPMTVAAPAPAPEPAARYIVVAPPRPMYTCTTPDGAQYTSDSPEGNPRWVPLWTLGYPVLAEHLAYTPPGASLRIGDGRTEVRAHTGGVERHYVPTLAGAGAGTWIRDTCAPLPQQETCARLVDRRDTLRRRFFNAQPSERARLDIEERGINARLDTDCGGH